MIPAANRPSRRRAANCWSRGPSLLPEFLTIELRSQPELEGHWLRTVRRPAVAGGRAMRTAMSRRPPQGLKKPRLALNAPTRQLGSGAPPARVAGSWPPSCRAQCCRGPTGVGCRWRWSQSLVATARTFAAATSAPAAARAGGSRQQRRPERRQPAAFPGPMGTWMQDAARFVAGNCQYHAAFRPLQQLPRLGTRWSRCDRFQRPPSCERDVLGFDQRASSGESTVRRRS